MECGWRSVALTVELTDQGCPPREDRPSRRLPTMTGALIQGVLEDEPRSQLALPWHENIRGPSYYH